MKIYGKVVPKDHAGEVLSDLKAKPKTAAEAMARAVSATQMGAVKKVAVAQAKKGAAKK